MVAPAQNVLTPNSRVPIVNKDGTLTTQGMQLFQQFAVLLTGSVPVVPSTATHDSNTYTIQPYSNSPNFGNYQDGQSFPFMAPASSTGPVQATVVPPTGSLDTLPVFVDNGGTQANSGDVVSGRVYTCTYHSSLDSGNGGFLLS